VLSRILTAAGRAVAQLGDRTIRNTIWYSLALTLALLLAIWFGVGELVQAIQFFETEWLNRLARIVSWLATVGATLLLFGSIVLTVSSLFLDRVLVAVERRWYPDLPPPRQQGFVEALGIGLRFTANTLLLNLLALPLWFLPGANVILFLGLNGWLIGVEYFQMVAIRRETPAETRRRISAGRGTILVAGALVAALSWIPVVNLLAPIFAAAMFVHLFYRSFLQDSRRSRSQELG
jgi:uncharacterized protein involved in cysteine biosynthesis